ncbi:lipase family protein [Pseudomonas chlororaphis]|uniref:lipase family protein n=1 Tax=Pseudomonas chlororaphis TaxID=587753 RepID=UPI0003D2D442|nr:lipase family protein [Pseudomonas chlororaphis]AZD29889.1 Lipase family protein [Pseudomonas chlororaphis]ETD39282.1 lipase [Pseudomonas chlororaphis subsp. aurantiaca PB-St2]QFS55326.1 lipase family protein [Pseudomonas chlororaphis subsp. aurantiaca]
MTTLDEELKHPLNSRMLTCPVQGKWTSFQLVDEFGEGQPYAGLSYKVIDTEGYTYTGKLDGTGKGKVDNHFAGPIALIVEEKYQGGNEFYAYLQQRPYYPLPITELQVRAEQTRYAHKDGSRTQSNPAQACADFFCQVEVRHFVEHVAHLPPEVDCHYPLRPGWAKLMCKYGERGVCLLPNKHNVLEVRPLRALRPMLSTAPQFCALNLYQLAIMATLSYNPFGQEPDKTPISEKEVRFPQKPSMGNWFGDALAKFDEIWKVDPGQAKAYYPLYEDVPYSKRLEIVPFDPDLYPSNSPDLGEEQEHPASIHFLDDRNQIDNTDTQAFITHNDELVLIAVRGTNEKLADGLRDADALQVPFKEGVGQVHRGFYEAAQKVYDLTANYLDKFHTGQKLIICGHSLGGAITLLLSEMLRRQKKYRADIVLYTYGSPRAADATFVKGAADLMHYRMVNHNDPVPSVPGTWMNTKASVYGAGAALTFVNVPLGLSVFVAGITNLSGEPYEHHGTLYHFFPVDLGGQEKSAILWEPGCDTITQHAACTLAIQQNKGLPERPGLISQILDAGNHSMVGGYIPGCWATLRRWQEALELKSSRVTDGEVERVKGDLRKITDQLRLKRRMLSDNPGPYGRAHERVIEALNREVDKVQMTLDRLETLRRVTIDEKSVYGSVAAQPDLLTESLPRWNAHPENRVAEQLAMAPTANTDDGLMASIYGHAIGAPHMLDIDAII